MGDCSVPPSPSWWIYASTIRFPIEGTGRKTRAPVQWRHNISWSRRVSSPKRLSSNKNDDWCWTLIIMTAFQRVLYPCPMDGHRKHRLFACLPLCAFCGSSFANCLFRGTGRRHTERYGLVRTSEWRCRWEIATFLSPFSVVYCQHNIGLNRD